MAAIDVVNRVFRNFKRYTGDGLVGEPVNAPLPVGDPQSGVHNPNKAELRAALLAPIDEAAQSVTDAAAILAEFLTHFLGNFADDASAATAAGTPVEGQFYWNTTGKVYRYYDGSAWQAFPYATVLDGGITEPKLADESVSERTLTADVLARLSDAVSPELFGAIGDGVADDTTAWQATIAAGKNVRCAFGKTYLVTASLGTVAARTTIDLSMAKIVANYDNDAAYPAWSTESLFRVIGADNVTICNGEMEYAGTPIGVPYDGGNINGVFVDGSANFTARSLIVTGFNSTGAMLGSTEAGAASTAYCSNPKVVDCIVTGNRAAGIMFGNTSNLVIRGGSYSENGDMADGGTGYGTAGNSTYNPTNTLIDGIVANGNARKGIDFHAGASGRIVNCEVRENQIYGIFIEGVTGHWIIANNRVGDMDTASLPGAYTAIYGVSVGQQGSGFISSDPVSFLITNNVIENISQHSTNIAYPVYIYGGHLKHGNIMIHDNHIEIGVVTGVISSTKETTPLGEWYDFSAIGNTIIADQCTSIPIYIRTPTNRKKIFSNNNLWIKSNINAALFTYETTAVLGRSTVVAGNIVHHGSTITGDWARGVGEAQAIVANNVVNSVAVP